MPLANTAWGHAHAPVSKLYRKGHLPPLGPSSLLWVGQELLGRTGYVGHQECAHLIPGRLSEGRAVEEKPMCGAERALKQNSPHINT